MDEVVDAVVSMTDVGRVDQFADIVGPAFVGALVIVQRDAIGAQQSHYPLAPAVERPRIPDDIRSGEYDDLPDRDFAVRAHLVFVFQ